jgi:acetyl-CoA/propionyl-CoA carboxylase biotin carboxyl carrier protein
MFDTFLVANRGEIAVRVIGILRTMGIRSAAVNSAPDAGGGRVRAADTAIRLGPAAETAPVSGTVESAVQVGPRVAVDQQLAVVHPVETP